MNECFFSGTSSPRSFWISAVKQVALCCYLIAYFTGTSIEELALREYYLYHQESGDR